MTASYSTDTHIETAHIETAHIETRFEELAYRESDGIQVSLLWKRSDNSLKVVVDDAARETWFELEVGDAPPLDVFHHPYAYRSHADEANQEREAVTDEPVLA
jgi:hypothetical protein